MTAVNLRGIINYLLIKSNGLKTFSVQRSIVRPKNRPNKSNNSKLVVSEPLHRIILIRNPVSDRRKKGLCSPVQLELVVNIYLSMMGYGVI